MKNIAIIVGAGKGKRIGSKDKAFLKITGKPILIHSILPFEKSNLVDEIILVVRKEKIDLTKIIVKKYRVKKITKIINGGKERQDSVYNALLVIKKANFVLVHDVARPLVNTKLIDRCLQEAEKFGSSIPAVLPKDTVKKGNGVVEKTLPREKLWLVQTPQVFRYSILKKAYDEAMKNKFYGTDDASLVEELGYKIKIVKSYPENIKITVSSDLITAGELIKNKRVLK